MEALGLVQEMETDAGTLTFVDNPIDFGETDLRR